MHMRNEGSPGICGEFLRDALESVSSRPRIHNPYHMSLFKLPSSKSSLNFEILESHSLFFGRGLGGKGGGGVSVSWPASFMYFGGFWGWGGEYVCSIKLFRAGRLESRNLGEEEEREMGVWNTRSHEPFSIIKTYDSPSQIERGDVGPGRGS